MQRVSEHQGQNKCVWLVCCERGLHARGGGLRQFKLLGLVAINAPENARGKLDITYVDKDLRISRGDKGAVRDAAFHGPMSALAACRRVARSMSCG